MLLGQDQRPDQALQGGAAVENGPVLALDDAGLLAEQLDGQLALGPERHDAVGPDRQLRRAEVEPTGDGQEPRGASGLGSKAPRTTQLWRGRCGPVGAAGTGLVEGAGAPDVRAGAMTLVSSVAGTW